MTTVEQPDFSNDKALIKKEQDLKDQQVQIQMKLREQEKIAEAQIEKLNEIE